MEFCTMLNDFLSNQEWEVIENCPHMPESCSCGDCPYWAFKKITDVCPDYFDSWEKNWVKG